MTSTYDAVMEVVRAWVVEGPRPDHHRKAQAQLRRDWPRLAASIERLVQAAREDSTIRNRRTGP